jgi:hypothetical protein
MAIDTRKLEDTKRSVAQEMAYAGSPQTPLLVLFEAVEDLNKRLEKLESELGVQPDKKPIKR